MQCDALQPFCFRDLEYRRSFVQVPFLCSFSGTEPTRLVKESDLDQGTTAALMLGGLTSTPFLVVLGSSMVIVSALTFIEYRSVQRPVFRAMKVMLQQGDAGMEVCVRPAVKTSISATPTLAQV